MAYIIMAYIVVAFIVLGLTQGYRGICFLDEPSLTLTSSAASKKFKLALSGHACARARARTHPRMHTRKEKAAGHKAAAEKAAAEKVFYDNAMALVVSRSQYVTDPA